MSAGIPAATSGAAGASAAHAIAEATKASGVIVRVRNEDFLVLLEMNDEPLAVHATGGFFSKHHQYLTSYRGLAFFTKSKVLLDLPAHCQVVEARKIWIPG
ncbi:MAG: hypothetical protein ACP5HU_12190 [Phycisphaerae bacterium]